MRNIIKYALRTVIVITGFIIILIIVCVLVNFIIGNEGAMNINWKIDVPRPHKVDVICNYDVGLDGQYLKIWYYNESKIKKIINNNAFKNIDEQSEIFIKQKIEEYYETLDDTNKNLFDTNIDINILLAKENYFLYIRRKDDTSWILLILDYKNNKMLSFENIY